MKRQPLIYLAGAIDNISKAEAQGWREDATDVLSRLGCEVYNPLTAVMAVGSPEEIIEQNEQALRSSDAVLAELWVPALHYGTVCEVEEAVLQGIPVVAWMEAVRPPLYLQRHRSVAVVTMKLHAFHTVAQLAKDRQKP